MAEATHDLDDYGIKDGTWIEWCKDGSVRRVMGTPREPDVGCGFLAVEFCRPDEYANGDAHEGYDYDRINRVRVLDPIDAEQQWDEERAARERRWAAEDAEESRASALRIERANMAVVTGADGETHRLAVDSVTLNRGRQV